MRKSAIGTALLLLALTAHAAENKAVVFTKSGMEEAALPWRFIDTPLQRTDARRVHWHFGYVEVKTPLGPLRLIYLPLMPPMHGTYPSRDWQEMPNPFVMTGTRIPQRPAREDAPPESSEFLIRTTSPPAPPGSGVD